MEWLRDVHKIADAPLYRLAVITGHEDAPSKIELYARNHYKCKTTVWEPDGGEEYKLVCTRVGEAPSDKYLVYRPLVDIPGEVYETFEDLLRLSTKFAAAIEHRFAIVHGPLENIRAVSLYARVGQKRLPTTYIAGSKPEFNRNRFGQYPDPKFLVDRPQTKADITKPILLDELE